MIKYKNSTFNKCVSALSKMEVCQSKTTGKVGQSGDFGSLMSYSTILDRTLSVDTYPKYKYFSGTLYFLTISHKPGCSI